MLSFLVYNQRLELIVVMSNIVWSIKVCKHITWHWNQILRILEAVVTLLLFLLHLLAGYIPNAICAVAAMLAASSIGAIWSSTSPDFGVAVSHFIYLCLLTINKLFCWSVVLHSALNLWNAHLLSVSRCSNDNIYL